MISGRDVAGMEKHHDGCQLAVGHEAWMVATVFTGDVQRVFPVWGQNIYRIHREHWRFPLSYHPNSSLYKK